MKRAVLFTLACFFILSFSLITTAEKCLASNDDLLDTINRLEKQIDSLKEEVKQLRSRVNAVEETTPLIAEAEEKVEEKDDGIVIGAEMYWVKPRSLKTNVAISDPNNDGMPQGSFITIDHDYEFTPKFSVGYIFPSKTDRIDSSIWFFRDGKELSENAPAGGQIWNSLTHPDTGPESCDRLIAKDRLDLIMSDTDYTKTFYQTPQWVFNWTAGVRYARLKRNLDVNYLNMNTPQDDVWVRIKNRSEGIGPKVGLKAAYEPMEKVSLYGSSSVALLAGKTRSSVFNDVRDPAFVGVTSPLIDVNAKRKKLFPILDLDIGVAVMPIKDFTVSLGYGLMAWFDALDRKTWYDDNEGVSHEIDENIMFDGIRLSGTYVF